MPDIEKVIKALECRKNADKRCGNPCEETGMCYYAKAIRGLDGEIYRPFVCDRERICVDTLELLKEQQEEIENLKQTCQSMMEGVCMIKKKDECVENLEHQYGCFELKSETAIYFTEDQFDLILKWMESTGSETIQDAIIQAIYRASIQGKLSLFNE